MPVQPLLLAQAAASATPQLPPGLYTYVIQGAVLITNKSGSTSFGPEQWGFAPPNQGVPPITLPKNPGMSFTTPSILNQQQSSANCLMR
jgi:hypothetical protein